MIQINNLKRNIGKYISTYKIINSYKNKSLDDEQKKVLSFIRQNGLHQYPYDFDLNRDTSIFDVIRSPDILPYVEISEKRLYFKRNMSDYEIKSMCACLIQSEQHPNSPHRYFSEGFNVNDNDIFVDVGAAEGLISLEVIDKVKCICIIESDPFWIEALKKTFEPYAHKVRIFYNFITDKNIPYDHSINRTLDRVLLSENIHPTFIKIDVEGHEYEVFNGASKILSIPNLKVACAAYHKPNDEVNLSYPFKNNGFNITYSDGYMIPLGKPFEAYPYLRRGIIRASK